MSDLIRREDTIKAFCMNCKGQPTPCEHEATCGTMNVLRYVASAERKGEWTEQHENGHGFWVGVCSQCGEEKLVDNYCPNCGCRMKGAEDE